MKSDSDDETYSNAKPGRSRSSRDQPRKPSRKKRRRPHGGGGTDDEDEVSESGGSLKASEDDIEDVEEETELGPNGRPKRKATKKAVIYDEPDSDEKEDTDEQIEDEALSLSKTASTKSLVVKLQGTPGNFPHLHNQSSNSPPRTRSSRARSGSAVISRPTSSHVALSKRSKGRYSRDGPNAEDLNEISSRSTRGSKGPMKTTSAVHEDEEEDETKGQQSTDELQKDNVYVPEIAASREDLSEETAEIERHPHTFAGEDQENQIPIDFREVDAQVTVIPESGEDDAQEDDDEDDEPVSRRKTRQRAATSTGESFSRSNQRPTRTDLRSTLGKRKQRSSRRGMQQESSDFEPGGDEAEEEDVSESEKSEASPRKPSQIEGDESSQGRRASKRLKVNPKSRQESDASAELEEAEELADELEELQAGRRSRRRMPDILMEDRYKTRRQQKKPNYDIMKTNMEVVRAIEEEDDGIPAQNTPSKKGRAGGGTWARSLFSTYGPFGGAGGPAPVLGGPGGIGAAAGADSDSSDDEVMQRPKPAGYGGTVGMTPTATHPAGLGLFPAPAGQVHSVDTVQGLAGTPANLGKVKDKQALADADPLGVDQNVNFDGVGGLQGHIDQLTEMVALPLLYPEVFQRFKITPPRGVLFHGPPGTGKTLLARALASSVSQQGKKVTFYMRKGADALSKWVGEAERQLRLLFDEARKNQPSIIFFDEIDGESRCSASHDTC